MVTIALPTEGRPHVLLCAEPGTDNIDVPSGQILDLYRTHGALLLRGFPFDLKSFRVFAETFCSSSVFNESPDRLLLDEANNIQSVNGGLDPFPLHPELAREPWKPDACFFCCLEPPRSQGETTVCDGVELVRRLPTDVRANLAARRLLYVQPASPETLAYWLGSSAPDDARLASPPSRCPYRFVRTPRGVMRVFSRPALHRTMFGNELAFGNFLLFARYYLNRPNFPTLDDGLPVPQEWIEAVKIASDGLTVSIPWQRGDLIMLDNSRFMHGRNAIVDGDQRLIASYFGYLKNAPVNPEEPVDPPWRHAMFRPPQSLAKV